MGKLVSITLSAAIDLMLEARIQPGVKTAPHDNENIMYFFKILKENNINIQKTMSKPIETIGVIKETRPDENRTPLIPEHIEN